jgi:LEA14-like dessication related protein
MRIFQSVAALLLLFLLAGCAGLMPSYEKPQINITSFTLAPASASPAPLFNIGIQVINPNRAALPLKGMIYSVEVEGSRLLSGATSDLPRVPGYGTADFMIEASPDLLGSARLLGDLISRQRDSFGYTFKARLDVGGMMPFINIEESGRFGLPVPAR